VCVVGKMRDLILQLSKSSIYSTKPHLITEYAGQYRHIQIASLPDRHEPDEGEINYSWIYALLDKAGYDGWIGCEYIPRADTLSGLEWFSPYRKK
ncbi:TIM barrel protein, partial [Klebsiella quasipneumoniae subsp. similipneumoniae]|uniref:TIM barrel protein n=1 Tax=Klebsiella quasipneumoniae TaxID=1463165 RepID=UPI00292B13EE